MKKYLRKILSRKGFTLIEMMVAFTMLSLLIYTLFSVFNSVSVSYDMANRKTDVFQNARAVLDQISREIKGAVRDPLFAFYIFKGSSGWCPNSIGDELHFITSWNTNTGQVTDIVELGYYLDGRGTGTTDDDVIRRGIATDKPPAATYNYNAISSWPMGNNYDEQGFWITNFTVEWHDGTAWNFGAFNPSTNAALRNNIPKAIRIKLTLQTLQSSDDKMDYETVISLYNSTY
ncbi:MAG: prepilin-type N-terminal cleavage/methylation domain-containing protein [Candidatus Aureabacteria bacterium]|nr:prepilin-type N-terminal cleavage/methylation domain-containing protein [Candidatus Auribacterota bacterium]